MSLPSSGSPLLAVCFMLVFYVAYSSTLKMEATCSSETLVDIHGPHSVISQKVEDFIVTAVGTSDPILR
jgi:hypothetical protein